jgi:hypothetical protein
MRLLGFFIFAAMVGFASLAVFDALPRHPPLKEVMCHNDGCNGVRSFVKAPPQHWGCSWEDVHHTRFLCVER